jgi:hypothetical protein
MSINGTSSPSQVWVPNVVVELLFPLPVDQRLLTLVQYNVLRGIATNMSILSLHHLIQEQCEKSAKEMFLFPAPPSLPASLEPTLLQQITPHELWIDLIPSPRMRDNAIRLAGKFDNDDLCADLVGGLYDGFGNGDIANNGLIVWTDPWHPSGWEITAGFARKWAILIEGCSEMMEATNRWRALREEEPLVVEL